MEKRSGSNFAGRLVSRLGDSSCLIDATIGQMISGLELARMIVGFAAGIVSKGLHPGDRIVIASSLRPSSALAYLGAMYAGIVPIPIEEKLLRSGAGQFVEKAHASAIWTDKESFRGLVSKRAACIIGSFDPCSLDLLPPHPCADDAVAALISTSGSAGIPRLVMVTHGNLIANTEAIIRSQHLATDERAMLIMPVSYCFGASVLHTHLYQGGGVVFDSRFMFPDKVLHGINSSGCTTFAGVPMVYNVLLRRSNLRSIPLPGLRRFLQAGGSLDPESVKQMREIVPTAEFYAMYGQTEATARISCLPPDRLSEKMGSAGVALDNLEIRIVDELGNEVDQGQLGEIQVRGPSVCSGYFDDVETSKHKFVNGWLKTGDSGSLDEDGFLWIHGRSDDFLKIRGVRVSLGEVEARVAAIAGVSECAAVGVKHPEEGEALALLVVADDAAASCDLPEAVRWTLPPWWTCVSVKLVPQLPRTANGKIARSQLPLLV